MTNSMIALAASAALPYFTADLIHNTDDSAASIRDYIDDASADDLTDAIDADIRDLLHNANLDTFIHPTILATMTDADDISLSDFIINNSRAIAFLIASTITAMTR